VGFNWNFGPNFITLIETDKVIMHKYAWCINNSPPSNCNWSRSFKKNKNKKKMICAILWPRDKLQQWSLSPPSDYYLPCLLRPITPLSPSNWIEAAVALQGSRSMTKGFHNPSDKPVFSSISQFFSGSCFLLTQLLFGCVSSRL
jgi:hypothetical protein